MLVFCGFDESALSFLIRAVFLSHLLRARDFSEKEKLQRPEEDDRRSEESLVVGIAYLKVGAG